MSLWFIIFALPAHAEWNALPSIPDREGFAGCFAGVSAGELLCAGGANFPDKKPWEGGTKVWTDAVYAFAPNASEWRKVGTLPMRLGYGVAVTHQDRLICVGGSNAEGHHASCFALQFVKGELRTTKLTPLPQPLANMCGTLVGDVLYVVGGQVKPDGVAFAGGYRLNLAAKEPTWQALPELPAGCIFATAANHAGQLWIVGGANVTVKDSKPQRTYLKDAYRFDGKKWHAIAELPHAVVAAPSPAPMHKDGFFILGGDDGSQVGTAPDKHPGFRQTILRYDANKSTWHDAGAWKTPRVTVPCVWWGTAWVLVSGEAKPGVRSPEVWRWRD